LSLDPNNLEIDDIQHPLKDGEIIEFMGFEAMVTAIDEEKYTLLIDFGKNKGGAFVELKRKSYKEKKEKVTFT